MIPIVGVSLEEALLGFGGDDAELHDKEVELSTSDITGSQTAIFVYNPQNEQPTPWDGYSLFTIDLSGVKEDIEELQQQLADMQECCEDVAEILDAEPEQGETCCDAVKRKAQEVVDENEDLQEEVDDLQEQLDDCHECWDEVVAALQVYDPDYDPQSGECPAPEIPKVVEDNKGYEFPEDTPYEDIMKVIGKDTVEIEGNDYYFDVYADGWYKSFNPTIYPQIDIQQNAFYTATTPPNYDYGSLGWVIHVHEKATGDEVTAIQLGTLQGFDAGEYVKLISLSIDYTNKAMNGVYETDDPYPHTPIQIPISADLTQYITTTSPNPTYRVKNK